MTAKLSLHDAHTVGFELVQRHSRRFVAYVRALGEDELDRPVPGLDWTVGETVTHVRSVYERYTLDLRRAASPRGVAEQNAGDIERLGVDVDASTVSIEAQLASIAAIVPHVEPTRTFPFHAGCETTLAAGWGNLLGELLAHGDDLARATGKPFDPPHDDLEILWRFTMPLLEGWLRPEARAVDETWELRFPFGPIAAVLRRGSLRWDVEAGTPADERVVVVDDVAGFTLQFPYRRRAIVDPACALLASRFHDL